MNKITKPDFLSGAEEAAAFEQHEFARLHQSTLAKVDVITHILRLRQKVEADPVGPAPLPDLDRVTPATLVGELGKGDQLRKRRIRGRRRHADGRFHFVDVEVRHLVAPFRR